MNKFDNSMAICAMFGYIIASYSCIKINRKQISKVLFEQPGSDEHDALGRYGELIRVGSGQS